MFALIKYTIYNDKKFENIYWKLKTKRFRLFFIIRVKKRLVLTLKKDIFELFSLLIRIISVLLKFNEVEYLIIKARVNNPMKCTNSPPVGI